MIEILPAAQAEKFKEEYIGIAESLRCTLETNNIVN